MKGRQGGGSSNRGPNLSRPDPALWPLSRDRCVWEVSREDRGRCDCGQGGLSKVPRSSGGSVCRTESWEAWASQGGPASGEGGGCSHGWARGVPDVCRWCWEPRKRLLFLLHTRIEVRRTGRVRDGAGAGNPALRQVKGAGPGGGMRLAGRPRECARRQAGCPPVPPALSPQVLGPAPGGRKLVPQQLGGYCLAGRLVIGRSPAQSGAGAGTASLTPAAGAGIRTTWSE